MKPFQITLQNIEKNIVRSRTRIVGERSLKKVSNAERDIFKDTDRYTFRDAGLVSDTHPVATEHSHTCAIVDLNLDGTNYMLHLDPQKNHDADAIMYNMDKAAETLYERVSRPKSELTGIITGGRWISDTDPKSKESMELLNKIAMFFDERGIPLSILYGKHNPANLDNAIAQGRNVTVWNKSLGDINVKENPTREDVEDALRTVWEDVEIAPEHSLNIIIK